MQLMKKLVVTVAALAAAFVFADVQPGEWNEDFTAVKAYADTHHVPMIAFLGATKCTHCQELIHTAIESTTFTAWQRKRALAMAFTEVTGSYSKIRSTEAYAWFSQHGPVGSIPLFGVYWAKAGGETVVRTFYARAGEMPVTTGSLVEQLIGSIESVIGSYGTYVGGSFAVPNTEGSHYEAEVGKTTWVDVRLVRTNPGTATNNILVATVNGDDVRRTVDWSAAATDAVVRVALPLDLSGDVKLLLCDGDGVTPVATNAIRAVAARAASRENPLWLGEREATGANALEAGEWTMDVDTAFARTRAQAGEAWTVAYCAGSLWCPDCHGFATNFLDKPVFMDWAREHNVALALVDMPRGTEFGGNPAGTPTLVSYEACDKPGKSDDGKSGASYLSRKMATREAAQAVFDRNHTLTHDTWYRAYDRAPRTGVAGLDVTLIPTLILFDKQGNIVAKLSGSRYLPNATTFTTAEYLRRLNEMLAMANETQRGVEGANNDWSTTADAMTAQGTFEGTLSAGDGIPTEETEAHYVVDYVKLADLVQGVKETVTVRAADAQDAPVSLALVSVAGGTAEVLAEASGTLRDGVSVTAAVSDPAATYVRVLGDDPYGVFALSNKLSSVRGYRLSGAVTLVPQEAAQTLAVPAGSVAMEVAPGTAYRIVASTGSVSVPGLTALGDGIYRADGAETSVTVGVTAGASLTYQVWKTGTAGFAAASASVTETTEAQAVALAFVRTGGASGRAELLVNVAGGTAENGVRYAWPTNAAGDCVAQSVVWEDGESGEKTLALTVLADGGYDGDETVELVAQNASGSFATLGAAVMTVTIRELETRASAGRIRFVSDQAAFAKKATAYAVEGTTVTLAVERYDGADGAVTADVACGAGAVAEPATLEWAKRTTGIRTFTVRVPTLDEMNGKTSFKVTLSGDRVLSSGKTATINVLAADAPKFAVDEKKLSPVQYVGIKETVSVVGLTGSGRVSVAKLSGSVPTGLSMKWTDGVFAIEGTPKKTGRFVTYWQVREGKRYGGVLKVDCTVAAFDAPVEEGGVGTLADLLPEATRKVAYRGVAFDENGLHAVLSLTLNGRGAMSLASETTSEKTSFTTKGWTSYDGSGTLSLVASARTGATVRLGVAGDGKGHLAITGTVDVVAAGGAVPVYFPTAWSAWSAENPASGYVGAYTATVRPDALVCAGTAYRGMAKGSGYLTLTMKAAAASRGTVSWAGMLPNGVTMSGSSVLLPYADAYGETMLLAVLRRHATDGFSALLEIAPHGTVRDGVPVDNQLIAPYAEIPGVWRHTVRTCAAASFRAPMAVYGGHYGADLDLAACAQSGDVVSNRVFSVAVGELEKDGKLGEIVRGPCGRTLDIGARSVALVPDGTDDTKLKFTFSASTGIAKGTFRIFNAEGSSVSVTWRGVVLPGWQSGCGECGGVVLPFVSGAAYFTDRLSFAGDDGGVVSLSVKSGMSVGTGL